MKILKKKRSVVIMSNTTPMVFDQCSFFAAFLADEAAISTNLSIIRRVNQEDDERKDVVLYGLAPGFELTLPFKGSKISVRIDKVDHVVGLSNHADAMYALRLLASSKSTLMAFLDAAEKEYDRAFASGNNYVRIYKVTASGGYWRPSGNLPKRQTESVVLDKDLMKTLLQDVTDFYASEEDYISHGIPYKHVVCLSGPPGTGKTSTVFALASHFNKSIAMMNIPLAMDNFDTKVAQLIDSIPKNAILVIEDIDSLIGSRENNNNTPPGLTTLLNVLDGNLRKHGMLAFLTTNYPERLDAAMMRSGRVDLNLQLNYATGPQASALYSVYFPEDVQGAKRLGTIAAKTNFSTADINMRLFTHRKDARGFWKVISGKSL